MLPKSKIRAFKQKAGRDRDLQSQIHLTWTRLITQPARAYIAGSFRVSGSVKLCENIPGRLPKSLVKE